MMANYAKIVNDFVENVIVADAEWVATQSEDTYILSTEENTAYVGGQVIDGLFIKPQPFPSWVLDSNYDWQSPIELPADGNIYTWDEANQVWVELPAS